MYLKNGWYVAAWSFDLKKNLLARTLLNEPMVLFRCESGEVGALEDRCCHRSAPLSYGRLKGNEIECGYHGLKFNREGHCVSVPTQELVPPGAFVKSYPVCEKNNWIWIWMGDAKLADEGLIPNYFWHDSPEWVPITDYFHIKCNYQFLIDIQLDQTHSPYVHPNTLGNAAKLKVKPKVKRDPFSIQCERLMPNEDPPPLWAEAANIKGKGDSWNKWIYTPPGTIMFDVGAAQSGTGAFEGDRTKGVTVHNCHAITPETEYTTHHFWSSSRNFDIANEQTTEKLRVIRTIFLEDLRMVEAQHQRLKQFPNAPTIDVAMDYPTIQARQLLAQLMDRERQA